MPCIKKVYGDKKESVHSSAARNKERFSSRGETAVQPRFNRGSTAGFVPPSVYIGFRLFVFLGRQRDVSSMVWRVRGRLVSWASSSVGIQSCPTPPRHSAVRSVPTRQWYVRVLDSTGSACSFFVINFRAICSRCVTGYEGNVFPEGLFCLLSVLTDPTLSPCCVFSRTSLG